MSSYSLGLRPARPFKVDALIVKGDASLINITYSWYKVPSVELIEDQNYLFEKSGILRYKGGVEFSVILVFDLHQTYGLDEACKQLGIRRAPYLSTVWDGKLKEYGITPLPSAPLAIA